METEFMKKLIKVQFGAKGLNPMFELFSWCINTKTRQYKRIDSFLKDQLENIKDNSELYALAMRLKGKDPDTTVFNIEEWVWKNVTYSTDNKNFGMSDYWAEANEVFMRRFDDCEGQNSLIFILCRLAGVGASCLYCVLGEVSVGYHFYCLYYSARLNKLVKLDTTAWPQVIPVKDKDTFILDPDYYVRIDYIFNDYFSFRC